MTSITGKHDKSAEQFGLTIKGNATYIMNMKCIITLFIAGLLTLSPHAAMADSLSDMIGKKQPLLLFAKSRSYAGLDQQIDLLRQRRPDISERDMVVLVTPGGQATMAAIGYMSMPPGSNRDLRNRFQPSDSGLTVVLVGKDGGEKGRWSNLVQPDEIFKLIDSMPMRQQEMQAAPATN